ncbi:MAG: adenosylcobinamide-phosphate synthase CbiB [Sulfuricellaceae bacterium]
MLTALSMIFALLLDALLGEPRRFHPLVGFGRLAIRVEALLHANTRWRGALAVALLLAPATLLVLLLVKIPFLGKVLGIVLLYFALGLKSLQQHARDVARAFDVGSLEDARERVGRIVSRDTATLDETQVACATVESVLENGNDAVFGTLFWFALAGAPGAVLYRLANTLDAMWGYKNARYLHFGWAAARFDDLMNYLPARLTALTYAALGATRTALDCWRKQAPVWDSPNAGPVMAAGAGALKVRLGGAARYDGKLHERPALGTGAPPVAADIERALRLVRNGAWLWVGIVFLAGALYRA